MPNRVAPFVRVLLPFAAVVSLGCQSPWQSGMPAANDGGWFSWMPTSQRTGDPLQRLAGGGAYSPGDAEADAGANRSRQELYGSRSGQLDLSPGAAQRPDGSLAAQSSAPGASAPTTLDQALPSSSDDAASRVARALRQRQEGVATPALAVGNSPAAGDAAVAPASYQAPAVGANFATAPAASISTASTFSPATVSRTYVDAAPANAESNPFFDPFGDRTPQPTSTPANLSVGSLTGAGIGGTGATSTSASANGGAALRMLATPNPAEQAPPTLTYPSGSSNAAPTGSLLRLLGDNPLRKEASAAGYP